ncbi:hypothetical protein BKA64DRAFT_765274 [Cadophora sp. MPI-SDFR-AT-0126]|nr:hypothetical protein BKA64DRAFT_765274 [Leotiomycetes sp. MPI-SDFR-AT-0126]
MMAKILRTMADDKGTKENSSPGPARSRLRSSLGPREMSTHNPNVFAASSVSTPPGEPPAMATTQIDLVIAETDPSTPTFVRFPNLPLERRADRSIKTGSDSRSGEIPSQSPAKASSEPSLVLKQEWKDRKCARATCCTSILQESRSETLVHYVVTPVMYVRPQRFEFSSSLNPHNAVYQFAIDFKFDFIVIDASAFSPRIFPPTVLDWLRESNKERLWIPRVLKLEIAVDLDIYFCPGKNGAREFNVLKKTVFRFIGLKELHLTACCASYQLGAPDALTRLMVNAHDAYDWRMTRFEMKIRSFLEKNKHRFTGGQALDVSIIESLRLSYSFAELHSDDCFIMQANILAVYSSGGMDRCGAEMHLIDGD